MKAFTIGILTLMSLSLFANSPELDVKIDVTGGNSVYVQALNTNEVEVTCSYAVSYRVDLINYRRHFGKVTLRPDEVFIKYFENEMWGQISHLKAKFKCQ